MSKRYRKLIESYQVLGLEVGASKRAIKTNHRDLIKEWHPDGHEDSKRAEEKAKRINQAYSQLKSLSARDIKAVKVFFSSSKRSARAAKVRAGTRSAAKPRAGSWARPKAKPKTRAHAKSKARPEARPGGSAEARTDGRKTSPETDPRTSRNHRHRPRSPVSKILQVALGLYTPPVRRRGRDVIGALDLSAREEITGARWKLVLPTCLSCGGWGAAIDAELVVCGACRGLGVQGIPQAHSPCLRCNGQGGQYDLVCETCKGDGGSTFYTAKFHVPPGIGRNFYGVVNGLGQPGIGGGAPGDLYILIV